MRKSYPTGQLGGICLDFREDPTAHQSQAEFLSLVWVTGEEFQDRSISSNPLEDDFQWEPEGASYGGELIIDPIQRFARDWILIRCSPDDALSVKARSLPLLHRFTGTARVAGGRMTAWVRRDPRGK